MSPEESTEIARSIANIWTFQTAVFAQLMRALQREGVLPIEAIERMLQQLDKDADILEGEDDQAYATGATATVRQLLAEWRQAGERPPGAR